MIRRVALAVTLAASGIAFAQPVSTPAGPWPSKPVRLMVGASPGGGTDIIARMLGDKLTAVFGQPFLVENRPGAANTIASDVTAKSPPDGYTLLVGTNTAQAIAPHIMKLGFDPVKDLTPIALLVVVPNVVSSTQHLACAAFFIKGGKVKALAVMTPRRAAELPDVPTLVEAGVPGVEMSTWYGFFGPANLPREITARLYAETASRRQAGA